MKQTTTIFFILSFILFLGFIFFKKSSISTYQNQQSLEKQPIPTNLSLPFNLSQIDQNNGVVNPFGVVRTSKDEQSRGHSGIDIPLIQGSDITAVADGKIVLIKSSQDQWDGQTLFQLLKPTSEDSGWAFLYEHVTPIVSEGQDVKRGQVIAHKTAPSNFTAHFQLAHLFQQYQYIEQSQCWSDFLSESDSESFLNWWQQYRQSTTLVAGWHDIFEDGAYPFRKLLDDGKEAQLCYPEGTDVR